MGSKIWPSRTPTLDVDGDADLDVVTSEQLSNTAPADEQLGVIWYANLAS